MHLLSARADAAGVAWRWDIEDRSVRVPLDRGQMEQALLNVLQNAVEAIDGAGTITDPPGVEPRPSDADD